MTQTEVGGSCLDFATKVMVDRKKSANHLPGRIAAEDVFFTPLTWTSPPPRLSTITLVAKSGSCLDFATKVMVDRKKTPYAIAFETYGRVPWEDISIYYATYTNSAYRQQHQTGYKFYDSVGENAWTKPERDHKQECMHNMFSPAYVSDAQRVFQTWVPLYHDVLSYIAAQEGWMGERPSEPVDEAALRKQLNAAYVTQSHMANIFEKE
eukprot:g7217.t1